MVRKCNFSPSDNPQIWINTQIKNSHIYEKFHTIDKKWITIKQKNVQIQIGSNHFHIIARIQFPIQLATTCTIHQTQGLTLDHFTFGPTNITKHGLTYIALSWVHSKKHLYLLSPLSNKNFQVNILIHDEMHQLKTTTQYKILIASLKSYLKEFIII